MSILGGVFSRVPGRRLPDSVCESLRRAISLDPGDERTVFRDDRVCFVKVDLNAFGAPACRIDPAGSVAMMVGQPLLDQNGTARPRDRDLDTLHRDISRGDRSSMQQARGTFCAAHYWPAQPRLTLVVDKLGLRSLYFFVNEEYVVFGSVIRILEEISLVPKRVDLRAVTEIASFGYPLGGRTPYADIECLGPAEIIEITDTSLARGQYWRWDHVPVSKASESELVQELHESFVRAVRIRLGGDTAVCAALSGGLDSRCVTAALRNLGTAVHTTNLAPPGTLDHLLSSQFAQAIGSVHENLKERIDMRNPSWHLTALQHWVDARRRHGVPPDVARPHLIWSGAGGSVGLGHVHMSEQSATLLRAGEREAAIQSILDHGSIRVIRGILKREVADAVEDLPRQGLREELERFQCEDPARGQYLFTLLNEQRRQFHNNITVIVDQVRLEQQAPFFDAELVRIILGVPFDKCLRHRFYRKWLSHLPPAVTSVPWQAYPGTEPCPLPYPSGFTDQWQAAVPPEVHRQRRKEMLQLLSSVRSDHPVLDRRALWLRLTMYRLGLRDYSYVIWPAQVYHQWAVRRNGP